MQRLDTEHLLHGYMQIAAKNRDYDALEEAVNKARPP